MKFSLSWIREFVDAEGAPAELARRLTATGLAVETLDETPDGDTILDIEVFSNRPDCMNVYGIAREVAAATGRSLCPYPGDLPEPDDGPAAAALASVEVEDVEGCGRYDARLVRGVRVGPSPEWITRRLATVGVRPVNNIVDATNYVLWEFGHPLHAFDADTLSGSRILVRRGRAGESLTTLDGIPRPLDGETLVIADAERPVALAGVMGGEATMVTEGTVNLLIESAHFNPVSIRRTSKRLALSTDASYRFERGADIEATVRALNRVTGLILELAGGTLCRGLLEARPRPPFVRRLRVRASRTGALLGIPVSAETVARTLTALQFRVEPRGDGMEVEVPSHRQDIDHEVDLIEEVGRSLNYDSIPERLPHIPGSGTVHRPGHHREIAVRRGLSGCGYNEAMTSSFVTASLDWGLRQRLSTEEPAIEPIIVENPITADQEMLRTTVLPGLLASVARNINRGIKDVRLYEIGHVFRRGEAPPPSHEDRKRAAPGPVEESVSLGMAISGGVRPHNWIEPSRAVAFHDLKGDIQAVLAGIGLDLRLDPLGASQALDPEISALLSSGGRPIGRIGALSPAWREKLDIRQEVFVAELSLSSLQALPESPGRYRPLPRFPSVSRDLSLIVDAGRHYGELEATIREAGGDLVSRVTALDRYEGDAVPAGRIGLTIGITFQHPERTLESDEVNATMSRILDKLTATHGVRLRA